MLLIVNGSGILTVAYPKRCGILVAISYRHDHAEANRTAVFDSQTEEFRRIRRSETPRLRRCAHTENPRVRKARLHGFLGTSVNRENQSRLPHIQNRRRGILPPFLSRQQKGGFDADHHEGPKEFFGRQAHRLVSRRNPPLEQSPAGFAFAVRRKGDSHPRVSHYRESQLHHRSGAFIPREGFRIRTRFAR